MELIYCTELPQYLEQDPKKVMTLDIETTGFVPPQDEILSLAIIETATKTHCSTKNSNRSIPPYGRKRKQ